jgi:hypothetical protein
MLLKLLICLQGVEIPPSVFALLAGIWVLAVMYWVLEKSVAVVKLYRRR